MALRLIVDPLPGLTAAGDDTQPIMVDTHAFMSRPPFHPERH